MSAWRCAKGYWRAWRQMPPAERKLLQKMWLRLQITSLYLRFLGLKRTLASLSKRKNRPEQSTVTPTRLGELMLKSARYSPTRPTCLAQAVTLQCCLHDFGFHPVRLVLGWKAQAGFAAHAWVDCQGEPLLVTADELQQYVRFLER